MMKIHKGARRKKRCLFCKELFSPDPRTYSIQKACQKLSCQKARKHLADLAWGQKNPHYFKTRQPKVRLWAKAYPSYWKHYRSTHPLYRASEKQRMRKKRALSVAKQDTISQNPLGYLKTIRQISVQTVAKQDAIPLQLDGILDYLTAQAHVAKPNNMASGTHSTLNYWP